LKWGAAQAAQTQRGLSKEGCPIKSGMTAFFGNDSLFWQ
jgi:hypothetical protein